MNEDFVSLELAKKLKQKGFLHPIGMVYFKNGSIGVFVGRDRTLGSDLFPRPTISQVLKWLREETKYNVNMRLYNDNGWYFTVQDYKGEHVYSQLADTDILYHSYEEAAIAGIEFVIDKLI